MDSVIARMRDIATFALNTSLLRYNLLLKTVSYTTYTIFKNPNWKNLRFNREIRRVSKIRLWLVRNVPAARQISRKLMVFDRKLERSYSLFQLLL